jgi:hypothetical protein
MRVFHGLLSAKGRQQFDPGQRPGESKSSGSHQSDQPLTSSDLRPGTPSSSNAVAKK